MITEDYCSFEVAKLLKEKGFDVPVNYEYHYKITIPQFHRKKHNFNGIEYSNCSSEWYSAPTHQMAMKWLRKEHNILLFLLPAQENGKLVYLVEVWTWNEEEGIYESTYAPMPRKEPEQAVEAAIKYCLKNLI